MAKYVTIDGYTTTAGLTHQTHNLNCLLNVAYERGAIPLVPTFRLSGRHNRGQELVSDLSKYYDYGKLTINDSRYPVEFASNSTVAERDIERIVVARDDVEAVHGVLWDLKVFQDVPRNDIRLPHQLGIAATAEEVACRLRPFTCVHVRRGDRITDPQLDVDTGCSNILDRIVKCGLRTVYIMTDEDVSFFDSLRSAPFDIVFYRDIQVLREIDDNYLLFCIERELMRRAARRVSTFAIADWPEPGYYDYSLSDVAGWQ